VRDRHRYSQDNFEWAVLRRVATALRAEAWELPAGNELRGWLLEWALILVDPEGDEAIPPGGVIPDGAA
jgi:hypothetical protein